MYGVCVPVFVVLAEIQSLCNGPMLNYNNLQVTWWA